MFDNLSLFIPPPSTTRAKISSPDGPFSHGYKKYTSPYLDLFFYDENDDVISHRRHVTTPKEIIFPLQVQFFFYDFIYFLFKIALLNALHISNVQRKNLLNIFIKAFQHMVNIKERYFPHGAAAAFITNFFKSRMMLTKLLWFYWTHFAIYKQKYK